ncbi:MAG: cupin domain-containing protein [Cyanobacteria bacterium P01_D01_bin.1]
MKKVFSINLLLSLATVICLLSYAIGAKSVPPSISAGSENVAAEVQVALPESIQWQENPNITGVESAIALGNPSDSALYVLFGKMSPDTPFPAHSHPDDRITTVLSGVMYYGIGETFDPAQVQAYPPGSVVYTSAGTPHFMQTKEAETIMQETGFGPTGMTFCSAAQ